MGQREELIQIFLTESKEIVELLDQNIVVWEHEPDNTDLLNDIFRAFHTLKGNAGVVGMPRFEKIAHITEEILTQIRDGKRTINSEVITFLLDSLDQLKVLNAAIEETGSDQAKVKEIIPPGSEKTKAKKATSKAKTKSKAETKSKVKAEPSPEVGDEIKADDGSWGLFPENITETAESNEPPQETEPEPAQTQAAEDNAPTEATGSKTKSDSTIRVDVSLLDNLMNTVGELVLSRNQIMQFVPQVENANFHAASQRLNLCTSELQESVMKTRMQPISNVFNRFPRVVRDVTQAINKKVTLKLVGAETELDKTIIEGIRDPLTHLVRNAIDHGIEDEPTRVSKGKDARGTLTLRAYHEGGQVNLEITDDGSGIDPNKIKNKAIEKGVLTAQQAEALSDRDTMNLIFKAGFSTAAKITNISGRGVGMDVVKTNIEKIGGSVEILSAINQGTTIKIKIPLTLAIIPALVVTTGEQRFAIPQINLLELVRLEGENIKNIERIGNAEIYRLRGKLLPIVRLNKVLELHKEQENEESLSIVVLAAGETQFGLIVDRIHDTEEIVVKPLNKHLKTISSFAGATVMGDGKAALILDVVGLADTARIIMEEHNQKSKNNTDDDLKTNRNKQTLLLFSINAEEQFGIPLSLVSRLETFEASKIQTTGNREVIKYRGRILPLLRIENFIDIKPPEPSEKISIIVFSVENNEIGFVVREIIDIVETGTDIDTASLPQEALLGSTILDDKITLIIDAFTLIAKEYPEWFDRKAQVMVQEQAGTISNILVVDDSPFIRAIERSYLESEGYHVIEANNGDEALERMTAHEIDLVVTDIEMPQMDGLELTRNIRANKTFKDMPVVAVSSLGGAEDRERGQQAGVDLYLKKLDRAELLKSLENIIKQKLQ